jgi:hypothetical protein
LGYLEEEQDRARWGLGRASCLAGDEGTLRAGRDAKGGQEMPNNGIGAAPESRETGPLRRESEGITFELARKIIDDPPSSLVVAAKTEQELRIYLDSFLGEQKATRPPIRIATFKC